jgi:hypothetical protein
MIISANTANLIRALRARSQVGRRQALEHLLRDLPTMTTQEVDTLINEVSRLCCQTKCRETWVQAKKALFILDPNAAIEMDRKHPFSELKAWAVSQEQPPLKVAIGSDGFLI